MIEVSAAAVTVSVSLGLVIPLKLAVIAAVPMPRVGPAPGCPVLEIVATEGGAETR